MGGSSQILENLVTFGEVFQYDLCVLFKNDIIFTYIFKYMVTLRDRKTKDTSKEIDIVCQTFELILPLYLLRCFPFLFPEVPTVPEKLAHAQIPKLCNKILILSSHYKKAFQIYISMNNI